MKHPPEFFGGSITALLANHLLNDMGNDPRPTASNATCPDAHLTRARETTSSSDVTTLTLEDYKKAGGMEEALSNHANEAYDALSKKDKPVARTLFRVLTERGADQRNTRRPTSFQNIVEIVAAGKKFTEVRQQVARVVGVFRQADRSFLMPQEGVPLEEHTVLYISHESLIRQWDKLKDWTREEAEAADTYRELLPPAKRWKEKKGGWWKNLGGLWRGLDIRHARNWKRALRPNGQNSMAAISRPYHGLFRQAIFMVSC